MTRNAAWLLLATDMLILIPSMAALLLI